MKSIFLNIVVTILVFTICVHFFNQNTQTKENLESEFSQNNEPVDVSMIQLIANPEKHHNKLVRVIGFVHLQFEGNLICPYEEDYKKLLSKNCLWLSVSDEIKKQGSSDKYMVVEGTFDAKSFGHFGMYSGTLRKIKRFDNWLKNPSQ